MGLRFYQIKYDHHCQNNSSDHLKKKGYFLSILCLIVYLVVKGLDSSLKYEYLINDIINGDTYI